MRMMQALGMVLLLVSQPLDAQRFERIATMTLGGARVSIEARSGAIAIYASKSPDEVLVQELTTDVEAWVSSVRELATSKSTASPPQFDHWMSKVLATTERHNLSVQMEANRSVSKFFLNARDELQVNRVFAAISRAQLTQFLATLDRAIAVSKTIRPF